MIAFDTFMPVGYLLAFYCIYHFTFQSENFQYPLRIKHPKRFQHFQSWRHLRDHRDTWGQSKFYDEEQKNQQGGEENVLRGLNVLPQCFLPFIYAKIQKIKWVSIRFGDTPEEPLKSKFNYSLLRIRRLGGL